MWKTAVFLKTMQTLVLDDPVLTHRLYIYAAANGVTDIHNVLTLNSHPCRR